MGTEILRQSCSAFVLILDDQYFSVLTIAS